MSAPIVTKRRADVLTILVFIVGSLVLHYCACLWPGAILLTGFALLQRQLMRGRHYDMLVTALVYVGFFASYRYQTDWAIVLPVLFAMGALYLLIREFLIWKQRCGEDAIEELAQEIEDEHREEHPH